MYVSKFLNQAYPLQLKMSEIHSSKYYCSQPFSQKEKMLLVQKIQLLETELQDSKSRETSLRKINSLLIDALNSNSSIQERLLTQIKVLNSSQQNNVVDQRYQDQINRVRQEILKERRKSNKPIMDSFKNDKLKEQSSYFMKSSSHRTRIQNVDSYPRQEDYSYVKQDNVFLQDEGLHNIENDIQEEFNDRKMFKSKIKQKQMSFGELDSEKYSFTPSTPSCVVNSSNFIKPNHKRRLSQRIYEIQIKQKQNNFQKNDVGRKSSAEIVKLIKEKEFIEKEIQNCNRKCNQNLETHIDSIVCIVKNRVSKSKAKGFSKQITGVMKQIPLDRKMNGKVVLSSEWQEKTDKYVTPRYVKKHHY